MRLLDQRSNPLDDAAGNVFRPPDPLNGQDDVLKRGEFREEGRHLERPGDSHRGAPVRRVARDVVAAERNGPAAWCDLSREDLEKGGLSGAVWTQNRLSDAFADIQVDSCEGLESPIPLAHAGYLQTELIAHLGPPTGTCPVPLFAG